MPAPSHIGRRPREQVAWHQSVPGGSQGSLALPHGSDRSLFPSMVQAGRSADQVVQGLLQAGFPLLLAPALPLPFLAIFVKPILLHESQIAKVD